MQAIINGHFGGNESAMAREFKVTPAAVGFWKRHGMSPQREAQIELWLLKKNQTPVPTDPVQASSPA